MTEKGRVTTNKSSVYHRAIGHVTTVEDIISQSKTPEFISFISENRNRNLWSGASHIKGRSKLLPSIIDGVAGNEEIA